MNDREKLWNAVEKKEDTHNRRASAQLAKEFMCQLPRELNEERQKAAMREWSDGLARRGLVVDWSLHNGKAADGGDNPHAHCMVVTRGLDANDPQGFGKKWAGDPSIKSGGRSKSPLDDEKTLLRFKEEYTSIVNKHLEAAGSKVRITHLSNEARGLDAVGGVHKGKDATAREKKGEKSYVADHNRRVGYDNFMRGYDKAAKDAPGGWLMPPTVTRGNQHKRFAEWQLLRGASMASRDASQKSQCSVAAPPVNRSEKATERVREGAKLATRQTMTYQERLEQARREQSRPAPDKDSPGRSR